MPTVNELMRTIDQLRAENEKLRSLLHAHSIASPPVVPDVPENPAETPSDRAVTKRSPMHEKIALFLSLFQGRPDVYARRWESKTGRSGYSPVCVNEWKHGVCLKPKGKCADCANAAYNPYDEQAVEAHLCGRHILGIYPLLQDNTSRFLAIDFDEDNSLGDMQMVAETCRKNDIPCSTEISRCGNGAYLWLLCGISGRLSCSPPWMRRGRHKLNADKPY